MSFFRFQEFFLFDFLLSSFATAWDAFNVFQSLWRLVDESVAVSKLRPLSASFWQFFRPFSWNPQEGVSNHGKHRYLRLPGQVHRDREDGRLWLQMRRMQEAGECWKRPHHLPVSENLSNSYEALLPFRDAQRKTEFKCYVPGASRHALVRSTFK